MYSLLARQPVWDHFAEYCLSEWRPRWAWIIGYGWNWLVLRFHCKKMAVVVVAVVVINTNRTTDGHLPMCLCAGVAAAADLDWPYSDVESAGWGSCWSPRFMTWTSIGKFAYGFRTQRGDTIDGRSLGINTGTVRHGAGRSGNSKAIVCHGAVP